MSTSIENMIVEMKFDNSTFQKGVSTTLASLGSLQKGLGLLSGWSGVKPLVDGVGGFGSSLRNLIPSIDGISTKMVALGTIGVTALSKLTSSAIDFAGRMSKQLLGINAMNDGFDDYNKKLTSVQTVMNATGKSMDYVGKRFDKLDKYADDTVYSMDDMTSAFAKFSNAGVDLDKSVIAIQGIGNATAYAGQGSSEAALAYRNFSDAISKGFLGGGDFLSLKNSNVITKQFKEEMIKAGIAAGTLRKEADGTFTTLGEGASRAGVSAAELFNVLGETQWADVDVLMGTLEKFGDETTKLGKKASKSARDVKSLPMLFETLKAQAGTGWTETFEIVVGDLKEAKKLWTGVADYIGGILGSMADARNTMFQVWKDDGGRDALLNSFANIAQAIEGVVKPIGDAFREVFGGLSGGALADATKAFERFTKALIPSKDTAQAIKSVFVGVFSVLKVGVAIVSGLVRYFVDFAVLLSGLIAPVFRFVGAVVELGNKTQILDKLAGGISKIFDGIIAARRKVMEPLIDFIGSFIDIFTQLIQNGPQAAIDQAGKAFSKLKSFAGVLLNAIISPFKKLGSLATLVWGQITDGVSALLDKMGPTGDKIRELGRAIADVFGKVKDRLAPIGESFQRAFSSIGDLVGKVKDQIAGMFSGLGGSISSGAGGFSALGGIFSSLGSSISSGMGRATDVLTSSLTFILDLIGEVADALGNLFSGGKSAASSAGSAGAAGMEKSLSGMEKAADAVGTAWDKVMAVITPVGKAVGGLLSGFGSVFKGVGGMIGRFLSEASLEDIMKLINSGIVVLFINQLRRFIKVAENLTSSFDEITGGFRNVTDEVTNGLKTMQTGIKSRIILNIAIAVGILAASLWLLSTIDAKDMYRAIGGLTGLMIELSAAMAFMMKSLANPALTVGLGGLGTALTGMGIGILAISFAVAKLAKIDTMDLLKGVAAVGAIMIGMGGLVKLLSSGGGVGGLALIGAAFGMGVLAVALTMLLVPIKLYSRLDAKTFWKGLGLISSALLGLGFAMLAMSGSLPGALGLAVASAALMLLIVPLKAMGKMKGKEIAKMFVVLGGSLGALAVGLTGMIAALPGAAALIVAAFGLGVLLPIILAFSKMDWGTFLKGIGMVAIAMAVFAVMGVLLIPASVGLLALGAALLMIGGAMLLFGIGLVAAGAGLTMIAAAGAAAFPVIREGFSMLLDMITEFLKGITEWGLIILDGINQLMGKLVEVIFNGLVAIFNKIIENKRVLADGLEAILRIGLAVVRNSAQDWVDTGVALVLAFLRGVGKNIKEINRAATKLLVNFLDGITDNLDEINAAAIRLLAKFVIGIGKNAGLLAAAAMIAIIEFNMGMTKAINTYSGPLAASARQLIGAIFGAMLEALIPWGGAIKAKVDEILGWIDKALSVAGKLGGTPAQKAWDLGHRVGGLLSLGLERSKDGVKKRTTELTQAMTDGLQAALDAPEMDDPTLNPTIRPVLDLSQVQSEASRMNDILGSSPIDSRLDYRTATGIAEMRARLAADTAESANRMVPEKIEFKQTINAPKALKTSDIYRATKSQIAMAKEELKVS